MVAVGRPPEALPAVPLPGGSLIPDSASAGRPIRINEATTTPLNFALAMIPYRLALYLCI